MPNMKKVVATRTGLKFGRIILEGEEFEVEEGEKSKWYRDLDPSKKAAASQSIDTNGNGKLNKGEILKWFEENGIEVDASLGVTKLREAHAEAVAKKEAELNPSNEGEADE